MNIAVIDIGTNSIHMLVVRIDSDLRYHELDKAKEMVRLGGSVFATGRIDEPTQARALDTLKRFARLAQRRGAQQVIAVATSAVREAENGGAFLQEVYRETGIHPRIISGAEEARLVFKAVQPLLPLVDEPSLVVDLGGGSAEFACGNARALSWASSYPLGGQRLTPLALDEGEPTSEKRQTLVEMLRRVVAPVAARARASRASECYVTSGSAVAILKLLRERGDVAATAEAIPRKALAALDDELSMMPRDKRLALPVDPLRVDILVPATAFFRVLADELGAPELRVRDRGVREGLVEDFIERNGAELQWELTEPNGRRRTVLRLAERFHYDAQHSHHVANLAISLFDATRDLHSLDERAREMLEYGALLHDIGYAVSAQAHHKHAEYVILHGLAGGFTDEEIATIAAISRYHRKSFPKEKHVAWSRLGKKDRALVEKVTAILRIADALDRSHSRTVHSVHVTSAGQVVTLRLTTDGPAELEAWAVQRKADWFERYLGRKIALVFPDVQPAIEEVAAVAREG